MTYYKTKGIFEFFKFLNESAWFPSSAKES